MTSPFFSIQCKNLLYSSPFSELISKTPSELVILSEILVPPSSLMTGSSLAHSHASSSYYPSRLRLPLFLLSSIHLLEQPCRQNFSYFSFLNYFQNRYRDSSPPPHLSTQLTHAPLLAIPSFEYRQAGSVSSGSRKLLTYWFGIMY